MEMRKKRTQGKILTRSIMTFMDKYPVWVVAYKLCK